MSAIIAVLNKQGIALAADSAETIDGAGKTKIFNRANKIFTLSKHHPVGVMIYSIGSFMTTPWETIIKMYRKQLTDNSFATLKEYQEDFITYIKGKNGFTDDETQKQYLYSFFFTLTATLKHQVNEGNPGLLTANPQQFADLVVQEADNLRQQVIAGNQINPDFVDYQYADFAVFAQEPFDVFLQDQFTDKGLNINPAQIEILKHLFHQYLRTKEKFTAFSGLVFVGFGEAEIYPSSLPLNVSMFIQGRLRYYHDEGNSASISNQTPGAVLPYAQQDVVNTILMGIDDNLRASFENKTKNKLEKQKQDIIDRLQALHPQAVADIQAIDNNIYFSDFKNEIGTVISEDYVSPLFNALSHLSKEDLAEMAESMIYLTYLKRRITFAEESVGGPVDVAVISKGDGFIWIKRKLYFDSKLNEHFFDNYLNS